MHSKDPTDFDEEDEPSHYLPEDHPSVVEARMQAARHKVPDSRALRGLCQQVLRQYKDRYWFHQRQAAAGRADADPYDPHMAYWLNELESFAQTMRGKDFVTVETARIDRALAGAQSASFLEWIDHTRASAAEWGKTAPGDVVAADRGHALRWREGLGWDNRPSPDELRAAPVLFLPGIDSGARSTATEALSQLAPLLGHLGHGKEGLLYHQYDLNLPQRLFMCGRFVHDHSLLSDEAARIFKAYVAPRLIEKAGGETRLRDPETLPHPLLRIVGHSMGCIVARLVQNIAVEALSGPHPEQYGLPRGGTRDAQAARRHAQAVMARIPAFALGMQMGLDTPPKAKAGLAFPIISVFSAADSLPYRMPDHVLLEQNVLLDGRSAAVAAMHQPGWHEHGQRTNLYRYLDSVPASYVFGGREKPNLNGHHLGGYLKALGLDQDGLAEPGEDAAAILGLLKGEPYETLRTRLEPGRIDTQELRRRYAGAYSCPFDLALRFLSPARGRSAEPLASGPALQAAETITHSLGQGMAAGRVA